MQETVSVITNFINFTYGEFCIVLILTKACKHEYIMFYFDIWKLQVFIHSFWPAFVQRLRQTVHKWR